MKLKVNIRDLIAETADHETLMLAPVGIEIDELFEFNGIESEREINVDIHQLLDHNRQIAHIWGVEDVLEVRPDLTDDQAWDVLRACDRRLDCTQGITWDALELTADELYPEPQERHWHGRIEVTITDTYGYGQAEVSNRLQDMCALLAEDMPDVQAVLDETSVRIIHPDETAGE